jgi:hypothetical protein
MRKLLLLAAIAGALIAARRSRSRDDADLWTEATTAIDLR